MTISEKRNTLASIAANNKKPGKTEAQAILCELAEQYPEAQRELAQLYSYFRPPAPKKPKSVFDWVAKAIGKDDPRYYLNYVHVSQQWITGTDGGRIHRAPNTENLEPGYYLATGEKFREPDFATYPDIDRVVPSHADYWYSLTSEELNDVGLIVRGSGNKEWTAAALPFSFAAVYVKERYLRDLLSYGLGVIAHQDGHPSSAVRFDFDDGRQAVIMPVRL